MRLAKYLASAGVASRRAAEELIRSGSVSVNGEVVRDPARDVRIPDRDDVGTPDRDDVGTPDRPGSDPPDEVWLAGQPVRLDVQRVVYAVNKPAGVVSTASDPQRRRTVVSLVDSHLRLYPVGRLDIDTTGLILLTNDGDLANRLTHPRFEVEKTYRAVVARPPVREDALRRLRAGVELEDGRTSPARVRRLRPDTLELTIHEGRKRQVRRMCEAVGHPVRALERVRFGPLELGALKPGESRRLSAAEVDALARAGRR